MCIVQVQRHKFTQKWNNATINTLLENRFHYDTAADIHQSNITHNIIQNTQTERITHYCQTTILKAQLHMEAKNHNYIHIAENKLSEQIIAVDKSSRQNIHINKWFGQVIDVKLSGWIIVAVLGFHSYVFQHVNY